MDMQKKIAVLFGGCSTEYKVSLESAYAVISGIDTEKFEPVLIGIAPDSGAWYWYQGETEKIKSDTWQSEDKCIPVFPSFSQSERGLCYFENGEKKILFINAALPVLHGKNGEDGTVQGVFELMRVPVIGCGLLASALCMDKDMAHHIVQMHGIKVPCSFSIQKDSIEEDIRKQAEEIGYPLFVKPVRSGSSFGISKVTKEKDFMAAVQEAFRHDTTVLVEEMVDGFEVGCAILGGTDADLFIGEVDEIELSDGFFDYTEKYTLKTSAIHVPARIAPRKAKEIKETALAIYKMLHCSCFARVDMFLTPDEEIYFNEVNTIPGFTEHSRYPNMLKEAGLSFVEMVNCLLEMV